MAHVPGHINEPFDTALIEAGQAAGQLPDRRNPRPRPSLFDSTARNLFGDINLAAGGRRGDLLGTLFGSVLPPSKKQKAAFEQVKKERAQKLRRGRIGAASEFAAEAGVSQAAAGMGGGFDPAVRSALEATARNEPGGREALSAEALRGPRGELIRQTERAQLRETLAAATSARINLPLAMAEDVDRRTREATAFQITNFRNFASDVRSNASMVGGANALTSFRQLFDTLNNPNASELDIQNGIVAMAQILEPGLAVRNDDRIAISGAASSGLQNLGRWFNQFVSGNVDVGVFKTNVIRSATGLIGPRIDSMRETLRFYDQDIAPNVPGVETGDAQKILGLSPQHIETMNQVRPISDFDLTN